MRVLAFLVLLLAVPAAQAQMYKCVDDRGRTRYSDKPITDCKSREVKMQSNTYKGNPAPQATASPRKSVSRETVEADRRCIQLRQENARLQRAPDTPERESRLQEIRGPLHACS